MNLAPLESCLLLARMLLSHKPVAKKGQGADPSVQVQDEAIRDLYD